MNLHQIMTRLYENSRGASRAAAVIKPPCDMIVSNNPDRINNNSNSKSKAAATQYETVVKKYDMGGSASSDNIVYQCGTHNFETNNLNEFKEHEARLPHDGSGGKAASVSVPSVNKTKEIYEFINGKH
jgi:G3E family GTPase